MCDKTKIIQLLDSLSLKRYKKDYIIDICKSCKLDIEGTKAQLVQKLKDKVELYCENQQDPISLKNISDITDKIMFKQNGKYFCFSKESISFMKSQSITKNPFCLDDVEYNTDKWDMDDIDEIKNIKPLNINTSDVPENVKNRFDIENSTDMYITTYIDFLENLDSNNCKRVLACIITNIQLHLLYVEINLDSVDNFNQLILYLSESTDNNLVLFKHILSNMTDIEKSLFFLEFDSMLIIH